MPRVLGHNDPGRGCLKEVSNLKPGMNFRKIEYRREVFLRFYEFTIKYKSSPGCVYFMLPALMEKFKLTLEQGLWLAYLEGCSQHIVTSWLIFQEFPDLKKVDIQKLDRWWRKHYLKFGWSVDRRYIKNSFPDCVANYKSLISKFGTQKEYFDTLANRYTPSQAFSRVWNNVIGSFHLFGRLATFCYLEYLSIVGVPIDCNSLFLEDRQGSISHRNGLCKVLGRDDLDWHKTNPDFDGKYSPEVLAWLIEEGATLLEEAAQRVNHKDVSYFTLESALCNYKFWFRPNKRYPNFYVDSLHDRIKSAEESWNSEKDFSLFWEIREQCLPKYLLLEHTANDPGICKQKQNHFRETGEVIMMDKFDKVFTNSFNKVVK